MDKEPESNAWKKRKKMAEDKLLWEKILSIFPEAQIDLDNEGQIIIYTGEYKTVQPLGKPNSRPLDCGFELEKTPQAN